MYCIEMKILVTEACNTDKERLWGQNSVRFILDFEQWGLPSK
ncbi:hypothetical protein DSUL_80034 [Desulfovibrionales bacterium]